MNKSCVAACLESVRMAVESVSGSAWNHCPDVRGMGVRVSVESADQAMPTEQQLPQDVIDQQDKDIPF